MKDYKVYYVYKNGSDGVTVEQEVILYNNASQHLYQKTYGIENFEDKLELSANDYYPMVAGNAVYTKYDEGGEHGTVLKITNNVNSAWTVSQLKPSSVFQINDGDTLKFDFKLDKPAGALNYCLRIYTLGKEENIQSDKNFWLQDVTNFGEWNTITLTGETAANVAANCYDYIAYVDNIRIEKAEQTANGSNTLQAMVNELFVGADEVIVKKVTDAEGTEVILSEGKFTQNGTYTVEVLVKAEGLNKNTFTLTYNVTI